MNIPEVIDVIEKLEARNNNYWNFYTVVVVAICGWVISQQGESISLHVKYTLIAGNAIFYFMNLSVIYGTTRRIVAFEHELRALSESEEFSSSELRRNLSKPFLRYRLKFTLVTHVLMSFFVMLFICIGLK